MIEFAHSIEIIPSFSYFNQLSFVALLFSQKLSNNVKLNICNLKHKQNFNSNKHGTQCYKKV